MRYNIYSVLLRSQSKQVHAGKVQIFWEAVKILKKNLPHVFDKSADLLSKHQNHEEDVFKICVLLRKSKLYAQLRVAPKEIYYKNWFNHLNLKELLKSAAFMTKIILTFDIRSLINLTFELFFKK